jgi:anti-anti-sigma factor
MLRRRDRVYSGEVARDPDAVPASRDGHLLLLYATEQERRAELVAWVRRGLERGEKILSAGAPAVSTAWLITVLADGIDTDTALRDRQLEVLPLTALCPPEGQHLVERSLAEGFPAVRISVEVNAALLTRSPLTYPAVERNLAELVRTRPVSAMCQYSRASTIGDSLQVIVEGHLTGVRQTGFGTGPDPQGLVLRGDLDVANHDVIAAVVCAAVARAPQKLRLDLAHVTFIDVDSCRRLEALTREFRAAGGQLALAAPRPHVERMLRLVELDEQSGIRLVTT